MIPAAACVAAAVGALLVLAACGTTDAVVAAEPPAQWRTLATSPLSPRTHAVSAWTGTEAVFLGGETGDICPPNADCQGGATLAKDGAAYDPVTDHWRRIADAPVALAGPTPPAVLGDEVFLIADGALLAYDAGDDRWTRHGRVSQAERWAVPIATGDGRLAFGGGSAERDSPGRIYDPGARTWTDLPADPLGIDSPWFTATPVGLVATGTVTEGMGHTPDLVRAEVLDLDAGTWRVLPTSDQIGGYRWTWTGTRMLAPSLGGADGGKVEPWGRFLPDGGVLDPATGLWGRLPNAPKEQRGGWTVDAPGSRWTATGGWVYDDAEASWTRLDTPPGGGVSAGSAVWAGNELIAFGGVLDWGPLRLSSGAWALSMPGARTHEHDPR